MHTLVDFDSKRRSSAPQILTNIKKYNKTIEKGLIMVYTNIGVVCFTINNEVK